MVDRSDLIHKANELRQPAELEANEDILRGLMRTADHYAHLAEKQGAIGGPSSECGVIGRRVHQGQLAASGRTEPVSRFWPLRFDWYLALKREEEGRSARHQT